MCRSLCYQGWAAEAVGPRAWDHAPGCLSVKVLSIWLLSLGHRVKINEWWAFMGSGRYHGHHLLVRPVVLNLRAKLAANTVLRCFIMTWEWMSCTGGEKLQVDAWIREDRCPLGKNKTLKWNPRQQVGGIKWQFQFLKTQILFLKIWQTIW